MKKLLSIIILFIAFTSFIFSQEELKSSEEDYYDFLSLQGLVERPSLVYRTMNDSVWNLSDDADHIWKDNNLGSLKSFNQFNYKILTPHWYNSYNSAAPFGQNDGAIWQGLGYNTFLTGGIFA